MDKFTIPPGYPGKCTPDALRRRAARLEVNGLFLDEFKAATKRFAQRNVINQYVDGPVKAADREQLRRYFCNLLHIDTPLGIGDQFAEDETLLFTENPPRWKDDGEDLTVNTKPLTLTTKTTTYVNGVDVNNYSDNELYDMIAREESKIRALEAIDNKPVMLKQEITRRKDGIAALVAHLDAVTVVPTPTPVVTDTDVSNAPATGL